MQPKTEKKKAVVINNGRLNDGLTLRKQRINFLTVKEYLKLLAM